VGGRIKVIGSRNNGPLWRGQKVITVTSQEIVTTIEFYKSIIFLLTKINIWQKHRINLKIPNHEIGWNWSPKSGKFASFKLLVEPLTILNYHKMHSIIVSLYLMSILWILSHFHKSHFKIRMTLNLSFRHFEQVKVLVQDVLNFLLSQFYLWSSFALYKRLPIKH